MKKNLICMAPFSEVEIDEYGNVNCCCLQYTDNYFFGNIFEQSFEEIWNGEKAKAFRQDIIDGKYTYCHTDCCNFGRLKPSKEKLPLIAPYPKYVTIAYDDSCNLKCITCRDKLIRNKENTAEQICANIEKHYLDVFKNAYELVINPIGECLISKHSRTLIQKVIEKYPEIKLNIMTNGVVCNKLVLEQLGVIGHLSTIQVSIHAATKETYDKITRTGNFDVVMKNVRWLSEEKRKGIIPCVIVNFVVHSLNYKELPAFVKMGAELGLEVVVWELQNWKTTKMHKEYTKYTVWDRKHPEFNNFLEVLKDPIFDYEKCKLIQLFQDLRKEALSKN